MKLLITALLLTMFGCKSNCDNLPTSFNSYSEAIDKVHSARFKIDEKANTSESSWIDGAEYFSCDGSTGYFILKTKKGEYIHTGLPVSVWNNFKEAESFGSFYDHNIKHNYQLYLK